MLSLNTKNYLYLVLMLFILLGLSCSIGDDLSGGSTETTNSKILGILYQKDGTPARGASVNVRLKATLPDTTARSEYPIVDSFFTITNSNGGFSIPKLDTGLYVIECSDSNDNFALIDSVSIDISSSTKYLIDTLKPAGAIKGTIYLSEGGDPRKVYILIFGINRFIQPQSDGTFLFERLAQSSYTVRILPSLDDYDIVDTSGVVVQSSQITDLDTIKIPFSGIPIPKNLVLSYDTLIQRVHLSWDNADSSLAKGYHVYRKNIDSNTVFVRLNGSSLTDTVFIDSTVTQGYSYEYKVTALDKNDNEGKFSQGVSVTIHGAFYLVDSIGTEGAGDGQFTTIWDMCSDPQGDLYILSYENNTGKYPRIQHFSVTGIYNYGFGTIGNNAACFLEPKGVFVNNSSVFVCDAGNKRIQQFNAQGNFQNIISGNPSDSSKLEMPEAVCALNNDVFISDYSNSHYFSTIKKYTAAGIYQKQWGKKGDGPGEFRKIRSLALSKDNEIIVLDDNGIQFFTSSGDFIAKIDLTVYQCLFHDMSVDGSQIAVTASDGRILLLDYSGNLLAALDTKDKNIFQILLSKSKLWVSFFDKHHIEVYQR